MTKLFNTENLSPMARGRLEKCLAKKYNYNGRVVTLSEYSAARGVTGKKTTDKSCDYSRQRFNRMNHAEQAAYEKRLADGRYYHLIAGDLFFAVPKIVYDCADLPDVTAKRFG